MTYRQAVLANGEFYHIVNRGVEKRETFLDKRDYLRFLETLSYYQNKNSNTRFSFKERKSLISQGNRNVPLVEIVCFCLMPNHFHLLVRQLEEGGITKFLSKISNSYTKYFNTKYKRVGPLFQGSFKAVRVEDEERLVHVSRYIHLNPIINYLVKDLRDYLYSSYLEYIGLSKGLCVVEPIINNFGSMKDYEKFVLDQEGYAREIKKTERLLLES